MTWNISPQRHAYVTSTVLVLYLGMYNTHVPNSIWSVTYSIIVKLNLNIPNFHNNIHFSSCFENLYGVKTMRCITKTFLIIIQRSVQTVKVYTIRHWDICDNCSQMKLFVNRRCRFAVNGILRLYYT